MSVRSSKQPEIINQNEKVEQNEGAKENDNEMAKKPLLERFEPGVLRKFALFTLLMFGVPLVLFFALRNPFGNIGALICCLISSLVIMASFVWMAFREGENNKN